MTKEELAQIKAELEKISSKGKHWRTGSLVSYNGSTGEPESFIYRLDPDDVDETAYNRICIRGHEGKMDCDIDASFIAQAPSRIAALVKRVEELENVVANLTQLAAELQQYIGSQD